MKIKTKFFEIEIEILFLIVLFLCLFSFEVRCYLSSYFTCYMFIVFHEFSHMLMASLFGKRVEYFKFTISGVNISFVKEKYTLKEKDNHSFQNLCIYSAGPLSNIFLALLFKEIPLVFDINLALAVINLFPIDPLDGFHIVENVLWLLKVKKYRIWTLKIESFFLIFLFLMGIIMFVKFFNFVILFFAIYLFFLKYVKNQCLKMV